MSAWPMVPLADILQLQRRWLKLDPLVYYTEVGVRSFGNGLFHKTPVLGNSLGTKRVLRIEPGDLVFNNVFAWEGAVGLAGEAERGLIGSHRFVTYTPIENCCDINYLRWFFRSEPGLTVLRRVSPGSAGRNRTLNLDQFAQQCIPLPPLPEQRRIVARVEAVAGRIAEAKRLREEAAREAGSLVSSVHLAMSGDRVLRIGDFLALDEDKEAIQAGCSYPQVGVKGFGEGLFPKGAVVSGQTTYKTFNRLFEGAVVLSQVKGWEGAIAVCPKELAGWFASPEYRTFRSISDQTTSVYLAALIPTPWFWTQLESLTRGVGARRERIRPEHFLEIRLPMPTMQQQQEALRIFARLESLPSLQAETTAELDALLPAVLNEAFAGRL